MADFTVQHVNATSVSADGETTTITAVGSLDDAFVLPRASMWTGKSASSGTVEGDDLTLISRLSNTTTITRDRPASTPGNAILAYDSVVEYVGAAGGANEMIVRGRNELSYTGADTASGTLATTPTSIDDCIPFCTGAITADTSNDGNHLRVVPWISGTNTVNVDNGDTDAATRSAHISTVEFTGSNWTVFHGRANGIGTVSATGSIDLVTGADGLTGSAANITDWSKAIIFAYLLSPSDAPFNIGIVAQPGTASTVTYDIQAAGTARDVIVHVLVNNDLNVTRYTDSYGSSPTSRTENITSAGLTDLTQSLCLITCTNSASGAGGYSRGWRAIQFDSLTQITDSVGRSGNGGTYDYQIIDLVGLDAGGGAQIDRTAGDALGLTDTANATQTIARALADGLGSTDAATATVAYARAAADTLGLTDTATAQLTIAASIADTLGLTDTATGVQIAARAVADLAGLTDTAIATQTIVRTVGDALALTDTAAAAEEGLITRTVGDALGLADTAAPVTAYARTLADTLGLADTAVAQISAAITRTVGDTLGLTDTATGVQIAARAVADLLPLVDQADPATIYARTVADLLPLVDDTTYSGAGVITRTVGDTLGLLDTASPASATARAVADVLALADAAAIAVAYGRAVADLLGLTDQADPTQGHARAVADLLPLADTASPASVTARTAGDFLPLADQANRTTLTTRAVADLLGLTDFASEAGLLATFAVDIWTGTQWVTVDVETTADGTTWDPGDGFVYTT